MRSLLLVLLILVPALPALAAPAPPARKAQLKKPGRIAPGELHRVRVLHYGSAVWQIGFQADGSYWCHLGLPEGRGTVWYGTWQLLGQVIHLEETSSWVSPDSPPVPARSAPARLELRRQGGKIVGTSDGASWGSAFRLE